MKQQNLVTVERERERERESGSLENEKKSRKKWLILLLLLLLLICFIATITTVCILNKNKNKNSDLTTEVLGVQEVTEKIKISPSTTEWTNENVTIKVEYPAKGYTNEISIDGGETFIEYTGEIEIEENTEIIVRMVRNGEVVSENKISITNIDKTTPEIKIEEKEIEANSVSIKVLAADGESGISPRAPYRYYIKKGNGEYELVETTTNTEYTFTGLEDNTAYTIKVEVEDNAGNVGSQIIQIKTPKSEKLQIDPNGGTYNGIKGIQESKVSITSIDELGDPTRTGYIFDKWELVEGDLTKGKVKAKWTAIKYTIEYEGNGATEGNTKTSTHTYDEGKALTENGYKKAYTVTFDTVVGAGPVSAQTVSYTFAGWSTKENGEVEYKNLQNIKNVTEKDNDTIKLYAQWKKQGIKLPKLEKAGSKLEGWYKDDTYTTKVGNAGEEYIPEENVMLYAKWQISDSTISLDANGGTVSQTTITSKYEEEITLPTPTREHTVTYEPNGGEMVGVDNYAQKVTYEFQGWYTEKIGGEKKEYTKNPGIDETLYAHWKEESIDLPTPTKTENQFKGWYTDAGCTNKIEGTKYTVEKDITLYAKWEVNKYTITLDVKGGEISQATITEDYGTEVDLPEPTKEGYTFKGWYVGVGLDQPVNGKYTIETNATIYAGWDINEYTITFDPNGGEVETTSITENYNTNITLPTATREYTVKYEPNNGNTIADAKATYIFEGWYTEATGGTKVTINKMPGENKTVYAHWTEAEVNVPTVTKTGYEFKGWYEDSAFTKAIIGNKYTPKEDITIYAKWEANTYTVKYDGNGETSGTTADSTHKYDEAKELTQNSYEKKYTINYVDPTTGNTIDTEVAEYTFTGWATTKTGAKQYNDKESVTNLSETKGAEITIYAVWDNTTATKTLPSPTKVGAEFKGWYTDSGLTHKYNETTITPTEDVTLYAKFEVNSHVLTLDANGGELATTEENPRAVNYGETLQLPIPTKEYTVTYNVGTGATVSPLSETVTYSFEGWKTSTGETITSMPDEDITLYAEWSCTNENVTLPEPTKTGHEFQGWYKESELTTKVGEANGTYKPEKDITLYAKWEIQEYTLTFDANGGKIKGTNNTTKEETADYGETVTAPEVEQKYTVTYNTDGGNTIADATVTYTFDGWYTEATEGEKVTNITMPAENTTLYAHWTAGKVTLPKPTKTGYEFQGWYNGTTLVGVENEEYIPEADVELKAQWGKNTVELTLNANGGKFAEIEGQTTKVRGEYGDTIEWPAIGKEYTVTYSTNGGTIAGNTENKETVTYTLEGWYTEATGGTKFTETTMPAENETLYAHWNNESAKIILPEPTKTGYTFAGWYTDEECTIGVVDLDNQTLNTYTPTADTILYAKWETNKYTITFDANEGVIKGTTNTTKEVEADYGATVTAPEVEQKYTVTYDTDGGNTIADATVTYTFDGWYTQATGGDKVEEIVMPENGTTLYAHWNNESAKITLPEPTKEGYEFQGWYETDENTLLAVGEIYIAEEDVTLNAKWEAVKSSVTIDPAGGSVEVTSSKGAVTSPITTQTSYEQEYNTTITAVASKEEESEDTTYTVTFDYNYNIEGQENPTETATKTVTTTYTFDKWTKSDPFKGTLEGNTYTYGKTKEATDTITAVYTSSETEETTEVTLPTELEREGYEFKGWYKDSACTEANKVTEAKITPTADITLYAKWEVNISNLTVDPSGGQVRVTRPNSTGTGTITETITEVTTYTEKYGTDITLENLGKASEIGVTTDYTVILNANGGTFKDTGETTKEKSATNKANKTYDIDGWKKTGSLDTINDNPYLYTFESGDIEITANYSVDVDITQKGTITLEKPIREKYMFEGWYTDASCTFENRVGDENGKFEPTEEETTLYAHWIALTDVYGKTVTNYTPQNASTNGLNNNGVNVWRIFHIDDNDIYLIAGDYILSSAAPNARNGQKPTTNGDYKVSPYAYYEPYKTTPSKWIKNTEGISDIANRWLRWVYTYENSSNVNMSTVAYMLDIDVWNNFKDTDFAKYAIGGPTIEMYCESYQVTHPSRYIMCGNLEDLSGYNQVGYHVKWNGSSYSYQLTGVAEDYNKIYADNINGKTEGYYIASPSSENASNVMRTYYLNCALGGYNVGTKNSGYRPIVCLKSSCMLKSNDATGTSFTIENIK